MKKENALKILTIASAVLLAFSLTYIFADKIQVITVFHDNERNEKNIAMKETPAPENKSAIVNSPETMPVLSQPDFYRGIYLMNATVQNPQKLESFIAKAKTYQVNVFVIDTQTYQFHEKAISPEAIRKVKAAGIWPVARVVVFNHGFDHYPVPQSLKQNRIDIAKRAIAAGFQEIQFDYIRFADNGHLGRVGLQERYGVVEGFLKEAKTQLKPMNVVISADIFGRIPLNKDDRIGQKMEGLAPIVDIIAPMAYPSHYTWSKKYYTDPYYTVFTTSEQGKKRTGDKAKIVSWIQGFRLKWEHRVVKMSLVDYIIAQIKASEDAGIKGFMVWNASQQYDPTWKAMDIYYNKKKSTTVSMEKSKPPVPGT